MHDTPVSFAGAVERRDYSLLQDSIRGLSKKDAVAHLLDLFPHLSKSWTERNLGYLSALDPAGLASVLGYADPTGEKAVRNVLAVAS